MAIPSLYTSATLVNILSPKLRQRMRADSDMLKLVFALSVLDASLPGFFVDFRPLPLGHYPAPEGG